MDIKIASNIKELREQKGMKQKDLATAMQTTQRKVSYWECGKVEPSIEDLWRLSVYFSVSIDYLVGKNDF